LSNQAKIKANEPIIAIGTLAEKLGVSVSTVRKYESEGLIISFRTGSGHRLFSLEDVERMRSIQRLIQQLGLNIEGIRRLQAFLPCWEILPCDDEKREKCQTLQDTSKPCWMNQECDCSSGNVEKCRNCAVYRFGSMKTENIKDLVHSRDESENIEVKIKNLINHWDNE
jgi:MerR family transcriptional regulator/heat shock protein HspR